METEGHAEGFKEGRNEGIREGLDIANRQTALKLKREGVDAAIISKITGISTDQIELL